MIAQARQAHPALSVRHLCALFGGHRAWYSGRAPMPSQAARAVALRAAIARVVLACPGDGYRRVTKAMQREGWRVNPKRVLRIMPEESLRCQLQRHFAVTTHGRHAYQPYPHRFAGLELSAPDQAWVADITYIRLPTTVASLACVLAAYSRRCLGWQLSHASDTRLT